MDHRAFARKDGLVQHIRTTHLKDTDESLRTGFSLPTCWSRDKDTTQIDNEALWCEICHVSFPALAARMAHVGDHFQNGVNERWIPRWAFSEGFRFTFDDELSHSF